MPTPLRVRTKRDYFIPFVVDAGQRNATFVERPWTPLKRWVEWADAFAILPEPDFDVVHAINAVPILTRRPYVLTFEDYCPRVPEDRYVGWLERRLQRELAKDRCVALLALSEYGIRQFRVQSRAFADRDALERKLELLYPAIDRRRDAPKTLDGTLRLAFVGHDWFRKGGPALLTAHERLRALGVDVQTTVVSTLRWDGASGYVDPPDEAYVARERARLASTPGVIHHAGLPNDDALRVMDEAHFFIFPTLHDTFGYVSLEALASGTPVVATATCAQPEIVQDGRSGFLVDLESDGVVGKWPWIYRTADPDYLEVYETTARRVGKQIAEKLARVAAAPETYEALSAGALARVDERFDRERLRVRLEALYEELRARRPRSYRRLGGRTTRR
jgi:glycosyltransferase involved in cell wall biosynthesis